MRDLVQFVQFTKHEKTHAGVLLLVKLQSCNFTKNNTPSLGVFYVFLNCTNGTE